MPEALPDIGSVPVDLAVPPLTPGPALPGLRTRRALPGWRHTDVRHCLYLPPSWRPGRRHALIVEYPGNGPYTNEFGDRCTGRVEDARLGWFLAGELQAMWACLPIVSVDGHSHERMWWGDPQATVDYALAAVADLVEHWAADADRVLLAGFSRGSIACNYIGLRNDSIAHLWRAFLCHSHYDGVRRWGYGDDDAAAAGRRLQRLAGRPQFISHEGSAQATRDYLAARGIDAPLTFLDLPYRNHTDTWVLRDIPARQVLRRWANAALAPR